MSRFHQWKEWITYKRKAKSRHGIHSPFVYSFIEKVLYKRSAQDLKLRILNYFPTYDIRWNEWQLGNDLTEHTLLILEDIHQDATTTQAWNRLVADERVPLSIDLYSYGLLFFRREQLQKQHYVLKA